MDPLSALLSAIWSYTLGLAGEHEEFGGCAEHLAAYQGWRARGGYEPKFDELSDEDAAGIYAYLASCPRRPVASADAIVESLAENLRAQLLELTGRDFGTRYFVDMLDAIDDAITVAEVTRIEEGCPSPSGGHYKNCKCS